MTAGPDLRLFAPAVAVWVVAAVTLRLAPALVVTAAAAGVLAAIWLTRRARTTLLLVVVMCAAAAACSAAARVHARTTGELADAARRGGAVTVEAVVTDDPRALQPKAGGGVLAVREIVVARIRVERLELGGRRVRLRSPVLVLTADRTWLQLLPSQRIRAEGLLREADGTGDVAAVLSTRGELTVLGPPSHLQRVAAALRAGLRRAVSGLPPAERGLLPGLVVGDVSQLTPDLQAEFRTVGLTHLTAVSGTNVPVA